MPVLSLGYLRLNVESAARWKPFAADFLGMMPVDGPLPGSQHYRMDDYPPRLVVTESATPGLEAVGFEVLDRGDLRELVARVEAAGIETRAGTAEECALRQVSGFAGFDDPSGNRWSCSTDRCSVIVRSNSRTCPASSPAIRAWATSS